VKKHQIHRACDGYERQQQVEFLLGIGGGECQCSDEKQGHGRLSFESLCSGGRCALPNGFESVWVPLLKLSKLLSDVVSISKIFLRDWAARKFGSKFLFSS